MTNKRKMLVNSFVTVVAVSAIGVSVANANFNSRAQRQAMVQEALKNNDLDVFKKIVNDYPLTEQANTKREFEAIKLSYELKQEGKYQDSKEVLQRVGIEHPGYESKYGFQPNIKSAIQNNDWIEFQEATKNKQIGNIINTKEKFNMFIEAHELKNDGRIIEATEVLKELNLIGYKI